MAKKSIWNKKNSNVSIGVKIKIEIKIKQNPSKNFTAIWEEVYKYPYILTTSKGGVH